MLRTRRDVERFVADFSVYRSLPVPRLRFEKANDGAIALFDPVDGGIVVYGLPQHEADVGHEIAHAMRTWAASLERFDEDEAFAVGGWIAREVREQRRRKRRVKRR